MSVLSKLNRLQGDLAGAIEDFICCLEGREGRTKPSEFSLSNDVLSDQLTAMLQIVETGQPRTGTFESMHRHLNDRLDKMQGMMGHTWSNDELFKDQETFR